MNHVLSNVLREVIRVGELDRRMPEGAADFVATSRLEVVTEELRQLKDTKLVRPEMPASLENRARFALPANEQRQDL